MSTNVITILLWIAMGAVLITLLFGIVTLFQGKDSLKSNRLMRWRIGFQILAILLFSILLWMSRG